MVGDLTGKGKVVSAGSQLAAYWQLCAEECADDPLVLYEDSGNSVLLNGANWDAQTTIANHVAAGSGMSMSRCRCRWYWSYQP